eukprot:Gb_36942 [translate_table: standard]
MESMGRTDQLSDGNGAVLTRFARSNIPAPPCWKDDTFWNMAGATVQNPQPSRKKQRYPVHPYAILYSSGFDSKATADNSGQKEGQNLKRWPLKASFGNQCSTTGTPPPLLFLQDPPSSIGFSEISNTLHQLAFAVMRMSCNGCRVLRKGCSESCILRPCLQWIKSAESQANATVFLAKFYGRAGLMNLIADGPEHLRPAIFRSLLYEACGRMVNPIYGAVGLLWSGSWSLCQAGVESILNGAYPANMHSHDSLLMLPTSSMSENPYASTRPSTHSQSIALELHKVKTKGRFKYSHGKSSLKLSPHIGSDSSSESDDLGDGRNTSFNAFVRDLKLDHDNSSDLIQKGMTKPNQTLQAQAEAKPNYLHSCKPKVEALLVENNQLELELRLGSQSSSPHTQHKLSNSHWDNCILSSGFSSTPI